MTISTKHVLKFLYILSWIIFLGLCIEATGFLTNAVFALANPDMVARLWHEVDLTNLFNHSSSQYFTLTLVMSIVTAIKAWLFYVIIAMLHNKKLSIAQPFRKEVQRSITYLACLALMIGIFSNSGINYVEWLVGQGVNMPDTHQLRLSGEDVWFFMAVILFVIAQIFKRGIEIQSENDLTV